MPWLTQTICTCSKSTKLRQRRHRATAGGRARLSRPAPGGATASILLAASATSSGTLVVEALGDESSEQGRLWEDESEERGEESTEMTGEDGMAGDEGSAGDEASAGEEAPASDGASAGDEET